MSLLELYCAVDDFCKAMDKAQAGHRLVSGTAQRQRAGRLSDSEALTIMIHFHQSHYRTFKAYYQDHVEVYLKAEFPQLISYGRFVQRMPRLLGWLCLYLFSRFGLCSGISFVDATFIAVCDNRRINQHQIFKGIAARGKGSTGWSFGFKLHLVVNDAGELLAVYLTAANRHELKALPKLVKRLFGKLFADMAYLSQSMFEQLMEQGIQLVTKLKSNMKNNLMLMTDKLLLRKRSIIETINDQLKNISQIEHSRHRSPIHFLVNLVSGLIAYTHQTKKPSLDRSQFLRLENLVYP
ncbi:MAG: IS982 family transposase [Chloroflexi bacterium]|nr:IS982 family transposase [Chloroflexota bacterium]